MGYMTVPPDIVPIVFDIQNFAASRVWANDFIVRLVSNQEFNVASCNEVPVSTGNTRPLLPIDSSKNWISWGLHCANPYLSGSCDVLMAAPSMEGIPSVFDYMALGNAQFLIADVVSVNNLSIFFKNTDQTTVFHELHYVLHSAVALNLDDRAKMLHDASCLYSDTLTIVRHLAKTYRNDLEATRMLRFILENEPRYLSSDERSMRLQALVLLDANKIALADIPEALQALAG